MLAVLKLTSLSRNFKFVRPLCLHHFKCQNESKAPNDDGNSSSDNNEENKLDANKFVASLTVEQRQELLLEIQKIESAEMRKRAEDKLASYRWRSRFGRPSSFPKLGADPTGTFCEIPEGWLSEKAAVAKTLSRVQMRHLALFNALPFIGFGFLDNLIMIIAGDYIDFHIGTMFSISTMAAAALGNTISDLAGIGSAWYVENAAEKFGVRAPSLTPEQLDSSGARWSSNAGRAFGVVLGCILGMFPLLFLPPKDPENKDASTQTGEKVNSDIEAKTTIEQKK